MRIKRLSFRNVGPFGREGVSLDGFSHGLNVVCETNEFGKSTLLDALELVMFKPFSSTDKKVKALHTAASEESLEGEIIFASDGRDYRLYKRFLKQKGARLEDAETGEVLALDRSAEERLATLLRSDRYVGGPSGLLWVRQGTSMDVIADDGQIASRLEGELGDLIGGARGRNYLARVESELNNNLTGTGQEKKHGPLRTSREAVESTQRQLEEAVRLRDQTSAYGAELKKVTTEIARLTQEESNTKRPEQITQTRDELLAAQSFARELELVNARYMQAVTSAERAAERQASFIVSLTNFNAATKELAAASTALQTHLSESQACQTERKALIGVISALEARLHDAANRQSERDRYTRDKQRFELLRKDGAPLNARLEQLDALEEELGKLTQAMSDLPVIGRRDVESLRQAGEAVRQFESELAALSTRLYLELSPDGRGKVTLDGEAVASGPLELTGGLSLSIAGVGELRSDDGTLRETSVRRDQAKTEYEGQLKRLGVTDISAADKIAAERYNIEQARKRAAADISRLAPEGRQALEAEVSSLQGQLRDLADVLEDGNFEFEEIDNGEASEGLREQRAKLDVIDEKLERSRRAVSRSETLLAQLQERLNGLNLPEDEAGRTAEADKYAREKLKTESDMRAILKAVEAVKARAPEQSADMLTARITRLEQGAAQARARLEQLKTSEAGLRARRDAAFEGGDADGAVKVLEARLEKQQAELARQIRSKDVRVLLRDTLIATQTRLREAYTAPVTAELAPLLSRVIPGAEAGLSEHLGVDTVQRNGKIEALTQLSGGTQEQFAILTRLAYARLLAKSGASAPVILDDALVYADDARRDAMFDVLGAVSSGEQPIQIIYLSCHAGATTNLGGTRLTPKPWLAGETRPDLA